jgi:cytochrome c553
MRLFAALLLGPVAAVSAAGFDVETLCLDCHRPAQTRGEVPLIEGQERDYLRNQLGRFRDRHRDGFPMTGLAAGLDDPTLDLLAAGLSSRPWRRAEGEPPAEVAERGRVRAEHFACVSCHGETYAGAGDIPRLAGQQPGYLARQIRAFAEGERHHPPSGIGARMYVLSETDAADIAAFLHGLDAPR